MCETADGLQIFTQTGHKLGWQPEEKFDILVSQVVRTVGCAKFILIDVNGIILVLEHYLQS